MRNKLLKDNLLFEVITMAQAGNRHTAQIPIEVIVDRGVVMLKGVVPSTAVKTAAEAITRRVAGVVTVINELEIRRKDDELLVPPIGCVPPVRSA